MSELNHYIWTFVLGWLLLWGTGVLSIKLYDQLVPEWSQHSIWMGVLIVMEWHFVWAAASGMETLLFSICVLGVFVVLLGIVNGEGNRSSLTVSWILLGGLCGLSVWVRPEGIILAGIAAVGVFLWSEEWRSRARYWSAQLVGLVFTAGPYLLFNLQLSGVFWPTTFYAKQAEYYYLQTNPLIERIFEQGGLFLVGVGAMLLPGFVVAIFSMIRDQKWVRLLPVLWILLHILSYAIRLPVIYQHGRYMMPAMVVYIIYGFAGMVSWVGDFNKRRVWFVSRVWGLSLGSVLLLFYFLGARSYAVDVAIIESEMVETAKWIGQNTEATDRIAAHDIGALGYFSGRAIIDLAGLVSPDVVPFIRDEAALGVYLNDSGATYLVTFPSLYPHLIKSRPSVFETGGEFSPGAGGDNMMVLLWDEP
ncbi:MAG: hypothetical protein OEV06_10055 [Anaerolineae bacterium]|nr:hypothetical protein [Anaerolineae bacterium]